MNDPVYLDCNATTPLDPVARNELLHWMCDEIGNAGSRTHEYGLRAKRAVQRSRQRIASVVNAASDEVLFTSGATEGNNIAILGLAPIGESTGKRHLVTTAIEHKAVLEPMEALADKGFELSVVAPGVTGAVSPEDIRAALRPDTLLVSVMHVNNETGIRQPIDLIARELNGHGAYFHVDAAQGFGKELKSLRNPRIDLICISSHKIYGPVGIGALVTRRRDYERPPLVPLSFGGGQERGLKPGTLPTALITSFGAAAMAAESDVVSRADRCAAIRRQALTALAPLDIRINGNPELCLPHILNFSVEGIDSEAMMLAIKHLVAVSNGSACTSQSYAPSHVLQAMSLPQSAVTGAVRMSWCHMTPNVDWDAVATAIDSIR